MIVYDMPFPEYLSRPEASKSLLDLVARAPALARAYLDGDYAREATPSMRLGTLVHCLVLEPESFSDRYIVAPECDRRTKEGKATYAEFLSAADGKEVITQSDLETALAMSQSVRSHPSAKLLLSAGRPEVSVFSELSGVECKTRVDWLRNDRILVDLKTTKDATPSGFARACANFDYPVQAAMYLDATNNERIPAESFVFVAVESSPPYLCATYSLDAAAIERGRDIYQQRLQTLQQCREANEWPGICDGLITTLSMPAWWGFQQSGDFA